MVRLLIILFFIPTLCVSQAGGFGGYGFHPLPGHISGATVGFSFRVISIYNGRSCMNVRRSSDNATQDIGFKNGEFDVAAFNTFVGGGSGFCVTWYNGISATLDATQATAANQPQIILSHHANGTPSLLFDATDVLEITGSTSWFNYLHSTTGSFAMVAQAGTASDPNTAYSYFGNNAAASSSLGICFQYDDRAAVPVNNAYRLSVTKASAGNFVISDVVQNVITPNAYSLIQCTLDPSNATANLRDKVYVNTTPITTANAVTNTVSASNASFNMQIGKVGNNVGSFVGYISEIIFYSSILTASQLTQQANNQNMYWNIY